ncbi:hypothetical protein C8R45DRAFT_945068 [Mycena sanguinolenta]|nr:hypothetical protein C8R45DRAFT_945068 [Mycena sanguinolenta]
MARTTGTNGFRRGQHALLLASAALTLTALFGCYSTATSNLHIIEMEPYTIYDACLTSLFAGNSSGVNETSLPNSEFFTNPLPWKYEVGIAGVCRVFNSTDLSSPSVTFQTECKRQLHPPLDLLHLIAQDLPNGTAGSQYQNWENLLNKAVPGFQDKTSKVLTRAHLLIASSTLLILSIIWTFALVVATIFIETMYPYRTVLLDILESRRAFCAWCSCDVDGRCGTGAGRVHIRWGGRNSARCDYRACFLGALAIGFAKLVVTPIMMIALIGVIIWLTAILYSPFISHYLSLLYYTPACGWAMAIKLGVRSDKSTLALNIDLQGIWEFQHSQETAGFISVVARTNCTGHEVMAVRTCVARLEDSGSRGARLPGKTKRNAVRGRKTQSGVRDERRLKDGSEGENNGLSGEERVGRRREGQGVRDRAEQKMRALGRAGRNERQGRRRWRRWRRRWRDEPMYQFGPWADMRTVREGQGGQKPSAEGGDETRLG